jgi:hypothetical protein
MKSFRFLPIAISLWILGCSSANPNTTATLNHGASLAGQLPANPLQWKVITAMVDRAGSTMSTLYGNDLAVGYARAAHPANDYPPGAMLSLVTWTQQEDPRWFGAKIPQSVKSVEFVTVGAPADGHPSYEYKKFEGTPLAVSPTPDPGAADERAAYLVAQRAAVLP